MEKDIDRIQKNSETEVIIRIDDFGGKRGLTIREFVKGERYTGFTKAGTRIPAEKFKQFKAAINSINEKDLEAAPDMQEEPSINPQENFRNNQQDNFKNNSQDNFKSNSQNNSNNNSQNKSPQKKFSKSTVEEEEF